MPVANSLDLDPAMQMKNRAHFYMQLTLIALLPRYALVLAALVDPLVPVCEAVACVCRCIYNLCATWVSDVSCHHAVHTAGLWCRSRQLAVTRHQGRRVTASSHTALG